MDKDIGEIVDRGFSVNSSFLFILAGIIIAYVLLQSVLFLVKSWKRAVELGVERKKLRAVVSGAAVFTIAPAVSILLGLITLSKFLGLPLPWLRLSVLGALTYELPAATSAANALGIDIASGVTDKTAYSTIAWVMTVGILAGIFIITFFMPKLQSGINRIKSADKTWGNILLDSLFIGMISAFLGMIFSDIRAGITGFIPVFLMLISAIIMMICGLIVKRFNAKWLENYALPISMLGTMAIAIPLSTLIKGGF